MRFLAYDVETANNKNMGSICAIGWCYIQNKNIIEQGYSLIHPNTKFSPYNIRVHGITEADVQNAPTFSQYWEGTLSKYVKGAVLIAHNASFDIAATEQALKDARIHDPGIDYVDFLPMCKFYLPDCEHYSLSCIAEWAGVDFSHHHAGEDARAIVEISKVLCERLGFDGIEEMIIRSHTSLLNSLTNSYLPKETHPHHSFPPRHIEHSIVPIEKLDDALSGCSFCITGDVGDIDRDEVERMILEHGGEFKTSVSKKTSFLVVGTYADYPPDYLSSKHRKALDLIEQGISIQILSADDFLTLIQSPDSDLRVLAVREQQRLIRQQAEERERELLARQEARKARKAAKEAAAQEQKNSHTRSVLQCSTDGNIITVYESVSIASKTTGINAKCIRDTIKGIQHSAGGYYWKYESKKDNEQISP